jgi:hypothetical protein
LSLFVFGAVKGDVPKATAVAVNAFVILSVSTAVVTEQLSDFMASLSLNYYKINPPKNVP